MKNALELFFLFLLMTAVGIGIFYYGRNMLESTQVFHRLDPALERQRCLAQGGVFSIGMVGGSTSTWCTFTE